MIIITWINIPYAWWSISLNSLGQQFLLGFFFPSYTTLLAVQIDNVLLLKQNKFLNISERAYSLIINNNTRTWNIAVGWSKYYFDFKSR